MKTETARPDAPTGDWTKNLTIWQSLGIIFVFIFFGVIIESGDGGSSNLNRDRSVESMTVGQNTIRQRLRFSSTASFSEHKYGKLNGNEYFYTALVRAENAFGNKVPSNWHVVVAFQPGTANVSQVISVTQTQ